MKKSDYLCTRKSENGGSVAQLNRASDYGSEGCGFESRRNHFQIFRNYDIQVVSDFFYITVI